MRKKVYYVMVIGALTGILAGCGSGKTETVMTEQNGKIEVVATEKTEEKTTTEALSQKEDTKVKEDKTDLALKEKSAKTTTTEMTTKTTQESKTDTERKTTEKKTTEKKRPKSKKEKTTEKSTKEKRTTESSTDVTTETEQSKKDIAKGYVGRTLDSLVAVIGKYSSFSKAESCYYEGEYDGIAQFDGFTVYCHSEGQTTWYIDSVE